MVFFSWPMPMQHLFISWLFSLECCVVFVVDVWSWRSDGSLRKRARRVTHGGPFLSRNTRCALSEFVGWCVIGTCLESFLFTMELLVSFSSWHLRVLCEILRGCVVPNQAKARAFCQNHQSSIIDLLIIQPVATSSTPPQANHGGWGSPAQLAQTKEDKI